MRMRLEINWWLFTLFEINLQCNTVFSKLNLTVATNERKDRAAPVIREKNESNLFFQGSDLSARRGLKKRRT